MRKSRQKLAKPGEEKEEISRKLAEIVEKNRNIDRKKCIFGNMAS